MKITVGALVLCKILVYNPVVKDQKSQGKLNNTNSGNITMSKLSDKMNKPQDKNNIQLNYTEKFVTGVVEEVTSKRKLVEVEKNKKFKYKTYNTLVVKTEELEKLVIQSNSCALTDDVIEDETVLKKDLEKEFKKKDNKKIIRKDISKDNIDLNDYEELSEEEILKLYSKYLEEHKKRYFEGDNSVRIVDLSTGKMRNVKNNNEESKSNLEIEMKEMEGIAKKIFKIDPNIKGKGFAEKKHINIVKKIEGEKEITKEKDIVKVKKEVEIAEADVNLFEFFEKQKKETKDIEDKKKADILKKKKDQEKKEQLAMIKKREKEEFKYKKYYEENPNMLIEAFKIILFE